MSELYNRVPRADQIAAWYPAEDDENSEYRKIFREYQEDFIKAQRKAILRGSRKVFMKVEAYGLKLEVESDFEEYLDKLGYFIRRMDDQEIQFFTNDGVKWGHVVELSIEW